MRTEVLQRYGIPDQPEHNVHPVKPDIWRVSVNGVAIDVGGALKLSKELEGIGEQSLAWHIINATNDARRNAVQGL